MKTVPERREFCDDEFGENCDSDDYDDYDDDDHLYAKRVHDDVF